MLIAAMNPCPCGYYGDRRRACRCSPQQIRQYQGRISGPLWDRIDIHIEVPAVRYRDLTSAHTGESSAAIKARVKHARNMQEERFEGTETSGNARMTDGELKKYCSLDTESQQLIEMAIEKLGLSARAYTRILKVARTIADLDGELRILPSHVAEAIQYRSLDRYIL
jgi:magnesium chelatase family protein